MQPAVPARDPRVVRAIALLREPGEQLVLDCTLDEAGDLEHAEEMAYLRLGEFPVEDPRWDVTVTEMLALPYYQGIDMPTAGVYGYEQGVEVRYDTGVTTLVLVGAVLEIGIEPTARHAADLGFLPVVVDDACGIVEPDAAQRSLDSLDYSLLSYRATTAEVVAAFTAAS